MRETVDFIDSFIRISAERELWKPVLILVGSLGLIGFSVGRWSRRFWPIKGKSPSAQNDPHIESTDIDRLENLKRLESALDSSDEELWRFHASKVPIDLLDRIVASGLKVVTFANLKGGVGKTTIAAKFGAFLERLGYRVILIDLDYQGSLSATVSRAAGRLQAASVTHKILTGRLTSEDVTADGFKLAPRLPNLSLLPAGYEVNRQEARVLTRWLLKLEDQDIRYALARLLSKPDIISEFKYVIIDTPPRLTLGTINALCASTHLIIPTMFNQMDIENVGGLLGQTDAWFRCDLNPHLELAGIVGTMTAKRELDDVERKSRKTVEERAQQHWGGKDQKTIDSMVLDPWPEDAYVFQQSVADTVRFREDAGRDVAYLDERRANDSTREVIDKLGASILQRLWR